VDRGTCHISTRCACSTNLAITLECYSDSFMILNAPVSIFNADQTFVSPIDFGAASFHVHTELAHDDISFQLDYIPRYVTYGFDSAFMPLK
jgi:hypothetical protein